MTSRLSLRLSVALALAMLPASTRAQQTVPTAPGVLLADLDAGPMTGKERQKACTEQWRRFSAAEKAAQGPGWPQFYTRCVKRLKVRTG